MHSDFVNSGVLKNTGDPLYPKWLYLIAGIFQQYNITFNNPHPLLAELKLPGVTLVQQTVIPH